MLNRFLVVSKSINFVAHQNGRVKTKILRARAKSQLGLLKAEVESRKQGSRPRPRTQKISRPRTDPLEAKAKDTYSPNKKRPSKFFFRRSQKKKVFKIFFLAKKVFKNFFSGNLYLRKPKKRLCRFSARFLAFFNKISKK